MSETSITGLLLWAAKMAVHMCVSQKASRSFIKPGCAGADEWDITSSWTPPFNKEGGLLPATVKDSTASTSRHWAGHLRFRDDTLKGPCEQGSTE